MKRQHRLTDKTRFRLVRQTGVSYSHPLLIVCVLANEQPVSRSGFTVSRRLGKAVERNRVRRRISEAVRLVWELVEPGWDMVWIARPAIKSADFSEIQEACLRLLRRARALNVAGPTGEARRPNADAARASGTPAGQAPIAWADGVR